jgi:hypothetical protein
MAAPRVGGADRLPPPWRLRIFFHLINFGLLARDDRFAKLAGDDHGHDHCHSLFRASFRRESLARFSQALGIGQR